LAYVVANLEIGAGSLQIAVYNGSTVTPPGTDVGGTLGAELTYRQEQEPVEIDQTMGPVTVFQTGEEGGFKITVREQNMRSLALAVGLNPDDATQLLSTPGVQERIVFGGKKNPVFCYLTYTVSRASDITKNWIVKIYRCTAQGLSLPYQKKDVRQFDIDFKAFPVSSTNDACGEIVRQI